MCALSLLGAAVATGGVLGTLAARQAPRTTLQPAALAAESAPVGSASSSWYCPGAPGPAAREGATRLLLVNAAARTVGVTLAVVDSGGVQRSEALRLGSHTQADLSPGQLVDGAWLAARIEVSGGAVTATELFAGRAGRAVAPCASEVSSRWYFASGSTAEGSSLRVALSNPTPNLAVVALSFVTSSGYAAPSPFQGLVVSPWTMRMVTIGTYVQDQASVATEVAARSGAVVAGELQLYGPRGVAGVALTLGVPSPSTRWEVPSAEDATGGASELVVLNPSASSEHVAVGVRMASGPVEPFTEVLGPQSLWTLPTSRELRIATQEGYSLQVHASGAGVVVARLGAGAPRGPAAWWAEDVSVSSVQTSASHRWVVASLPAAVPARGRPSAARAAPTKAAAASPTKSAGVSPPTLVLENPGRRALRVEVASWLGASRSSHAVEVPALGTARLAAPSGPAFVQADGPLAVVGDASPAGTSGVVAIPAIPLG